MVILVNRSTYASNVFITGYKADQNNSKTFFSKERAVKLKLQKEIGMTLIKVAIFIYVIAVMKLWSAGV